MGAKLDFYKRALRNRAKKGFLGYPVATIALGKDASAKVIGMVIDENQVPIEGVQVGVVGYGAEAWITQKGGNFSLPAHKANGQQVQLYASKEGYSAIIPEWHQFWNNMYVRGAVSGIGVVNLYISCSEMFRLRRFSRR